MRYLKTLSIAVAVAALAACDATSATSAETPGVDALAGGSRILAFAAGSGQFTTDTLVRPVPDGKWRTFTFEAKKDMTGPKGTFQLMNRAQDVRMSGRVTCLAVTGNVARVTGVVTSSSDKTRIGHIVVWQVLDNGGRAGNPPDRISPVYTTPDFPCDIEWGADLYPIEAGNILVK